MNLTLPAYYRIRNTSEFDHVFKKRRKLYVGKLLTYYCQNDHPHPRFGVVISKRNLQHAVDRNRVRRVLKELFRLNQHHLPAWDVVIVAQKGIGNLQDQELWQTGVQLLERLMQLSSK